MQVTQYQRFTFDCPSGDQELVEIRGREVSAQLFPGVRGVWRH
jgi:hypothetical protein